MDTPMIRPRRLRQNSTLRKLVQETQIRTEDLILPLFIHHGKNIKNPITSMPGHYQLSLDHLENELEEIAQLGLPGVILFGIPAFKNSKGSSAIGTDALIPRAIEIIKKSHPQLLVIADCCFCEYTDHGHCGILDSKNQVDNDKTLPFLAEQAISLAQAGADIIAPSGMLDRMVTTIRQALDQENFTQTLILSYTVKYASSLYGPFREAAEGAPKFGDRRGYQMDPANRLEALREAELDVLEGADMLMVKPAGAYLDIIQQVKANFKLPLAAYQVSGEYAMIKAAGAKGWINEQDVAYESLLAIKRAGADFIITYFAKTINLK